MRYLILFLMALLLASLANTAEARGRRGYSQPVAQSNAVPAGHSNATAQGVAGIMAALGRVAHFGGNHGYEGCGCGASPSAAYNTCCYRTSGMTTVDVGYARAANGMWFCCRRYR